MKDFNFFFSFLTYLQARQTKFKIESIKSNNRKNIILYIKKKTENYD